MQRAIPRRNAIGFRRAPICQNNPASRYGAARCHPLGRLPISRNWPPRWSMGISFPRCPPTWI